MIEFIFGVASFILGLIFGEFTLTQKGGVLILFVLFVLSSLLFIRRDFIKKIKPYYTLFILQTIVFVIINFYLLTTKFFPNIFINAILLSLVATFFIFFTLSTVAPLRYKEGLVIFYPKLFRVPINGNTFEFTIHNTTPLACNVDIFINLPNNVYFNRDYQKEIRRSLIIKPFSKIMPRFKIFSNQNNKEYVSLLIIKSNISRVWEKEIMFRT